MTRFVSVITDVWENKKPDCVEVWAHMEDDSCIYLFNKNEGDKEFDFELLKGHTVSEARLIKLSQSGSI